MPNIDFEENLKVLFASEAIALLQLFCALKTTIKKDIFCGLCRALFNYSNKMLYTRSVTRYCSRLLLLIPYFILPALNKCTHFSWNKQERTIILCKYCCHLEHHVKQKSNNCWLFSKNQTSNINSFFNILGSDWLKQILHIIAFSMFEATKVNANYTYNKLLKYV